MANVEINDLTPKTTPLRTDEIEVQATGGGASAKATLTNVGQLITGVVNVKRDHDAKGDGTTDDSAAIRLALAAGDNIFFPDGTYLVSQDAANTYAIQVASGKRLFGFGRGRSIIKLANSQDVNVFETVNNSTNVHLAELEIDGNRGNQTEGATSRGIFYKTSLPSTSVDVLVSGCYIHDCREDGIGVGAGTVGIQILGNRIKDCGDVTNFGSCISIKASGSLESATGCNRIAVVGNIVSGASNANIEVLGSNYSITGNTCFDTDTGDNISTYAWEGAKQGTITGNVCDNSFLNGIHSGGDDITIIGNTITASGGRGISHAHTKNDVAFKNVSITGNIISGTTGGNGIGVHDITTGLVISNNVCEGGNVSGIFLDDVGLTGHKEAVVTGNNCKSNDVTGITILNTFNCKINDNLCNNNTLDGIRITGSLSDENTVQNNTCMNNGQDGIGLETGAAGCVLTGNKLKGNTGDSINAADAETATNYISQNITDDSRTVASSNTISIPAWVGSGEHIRITGTTTITAINDRHDGFVILLHLSTTIIIQDTTNLHLAGADFNAIADDSITLQYDATDDFWREIARNASTFSTVNSITSGTTQTQAGATALTAEFNRVATHGNTDDGVKLPTAVAGLLCVIQNDSATADLQVWPATGDAIESASVNAVGVTKIGADGSTTYIAVDITTWYITN